jgi:hypothetical protein
MNKGLIYPDECYAIRRAIYEVYDEIGSGFREAMGFVIPFVKIRVPRRIFARAEGVGLPEREARTP